MFFRARSWGVEGEPGMSAGLMTPLSIWCPERATYGNTGLERCFGFFSSVRGVICAFPRVHLTVNLNASTFDVKPHSGDTDPGGFCPSSASSLV